MRRRQRSRMANCGAMVPEPRNFEVEIMFVRNAWYVAAAIAEIDDKPLARTILNEPIVIFKNGRGEICALEDRCCHRGAPLALGDPTETGIRCGYHGMEFNREGVCTFIPGQTII